MIRKLVYKLSKIKTDRWFDIFCIFFKFLVGQFSGSMAMLDNFMGHVGRSGIAGSVDSATRIPSSIFPLLRRKSQIGLIKSLFWSREHITTKFQVSISKTVREDRF